MIRSVFLLHLFKLCILNLILLSVTGHDKFLPPNFSIHVYNGKTYYFNKQTGKSQWERPVEESIGTSQSPKEDLTENIQPVNNLNTRNESVTQPKSPPSVKETLDIARLEKTARDKDDIISKLQRTSEQLQTDKASFVAQLSAANELRLRLEQRLNETVLSKEPLLNKVEELSSTVDVLRSQLEEAEADKRQLATLATSIESKLVRLEKLLEEEDRNNTLLRCDLRLARVREAELRAELEDTQEKLEYVAGKGRQSDPSERPHSKYSYRQWAAQVRAWVSKAQTLTGASPANNITEVPPNIAEADVAEAPPDGVVADLEETERLRAEVSALRAEMAIKGEALAKASMTAAMRGLVIMVQQQVTDTIESILASERAARRIAESAVTCNSVASSTACRAADTIRPAPSAGSPSRTQRLRQEDIERLRGIVGSQQPEQSSVAAETPTTASVNDTKTVEKSTKPFSFFGLSF